MTNRPNLTVFAIALAGTIVTGLWLVQYFMGGEPSLGVGGALFAFMILGSIAFRMNRDYMHHDQEVENKRARERAEILKLYADANLEAVEPPAGELVAMTVNGRIVQRYKPKDPHEAAWRDTLEEFLYHAWSAQSLSGPSLIGRAVKSSDDWFDLTEVLMKSGIVMKRNGIGTTFAPRWTYRRAIAAVQLGEIAIAIPAKSPPSILRRAKSAAKGGEKVESLRTSEKLEERLEARLEA